MKEFILFFRMDVVNKSAQPSPEQMQMYMKSWNGWIDNITKSKRMANSGSSLLPNGMVVRPNSIKEQNPYIANNESVGGYIIVKAKDLSDAAIIAEKCPILFGGNNCVEIRELNK